MVGNAGQYEEIIACPDCEGKLQAIECNDDIQAFVCGKCLILFPVKDGIPILLPREARRYHLEYDLLDSIGQGPNQSRKWLAQCTQNTRNLLNQCKDKSSWEWEDEKHWSKIYAEESTRTAPKNWNDRIWQREFLCNTLIAQTSLRGKTILDVGSGEGQNFRFLLANYCDETTLYIATDISFPGLKLNQARNMHRNSLYILCTADSLPIQRERIDVLCYFGILHHTEKKSDVILNNRDLVKSGGYILLHEPLARPAPVFLSSLLKPKVGESYHEERIDIQKLTAVISDSNLEILAARLHNTIFFTGMMRLFNNIMLNNKTFFRLVSWFDNALMKILGGIIPYFRAGGIMLVLRSQKLS